MDRRSQGTGPHPVWAVLLCVLPLLLFVLLALAGLRVRPPLFWLFLGLALLLVWSFMRSVLSTAAAADVARAPMPAGEPQLPQGEPVAALLARGAAVFEPERVRSGQRAVVVEGRLRTPPAEAFRSLRELFAGSGYAPRLQEDDGGGAVLVLVREDAQKPSASGRLPWANLGLLAATVLTTTWAGAAHRGIDLWREPGRLVEGLPYALALMLILGTHELGHYLAARRHGVSVTLPYFIPVPFGLGTFGAFIRMRSVPPNRRALFDVAVAGPLAGLAVAVPALLYGLTRSQVLAAAPAGGMHGGADVGSSVLLALLARTALGPELATGHLLQLDPLAFAGWLGLMVTALNLLPIGQLDGGHIAHALFGRRRADALGTAALLGLLLLGLFVWPGFLTWALIVFFLTGTKTAPPLEDLTPVDRGRVALGALAFILLLLILAPVPRGLFPAIGLHSPYL